MRERVAAVVVFGIVALHVACSSDDDAPVAAPSPDGGASSSSNSSSSSGNAADATTPPPATPCAALAAHHCELLFRCVAASVKGRADVLAACKAREEVVCNRREKLAGVTSLTAACAPALGPSACAHSADADTIPNACSPKGTLTGAAACEDDRQCASGYCHAGAGPCGHCADVVPANGACTFGDRCADGLVCAKGTCQAPFALNAACDDVECGPNAYCAGATGATPGTCKAYLAEGAPCTANDLCDLTLSLDCGGTSTCTRVPYVGNDETCRPYQPNVAYCMNGEGCQIEGPQGGVCDVELEDGAACDPNGDKSCHEQSSCVSGTCQLTPADACPQ